MGWTNSGWRSDQGGWYKTSAAAPTFSALINFRGTSGYVTDGAGQTYCVGDTFPTSRSGLSFGWDSVSSVDRNSGVDPRFAGINFVSSGSLQVFTLTLPSAGVYNVDYAVGDAGGFSQSTQITIKDNTTVRNTGGTLATSGTQFADIAGTLHATSTAWISNHAPAALTFASTTFKLELSGVGAAGVITHLAITQ